MAMRSSSSVASGNRSSASSTYGSETSSASKSASKRSGSSGSSTSSSVSRSSATSASEDRRSNEAARKRRPSPAKQVPRKRRSSGEERKSRERVESRRSRDRSARRRRDSEDRSDKEKDRRHRDADRRTASPVPTRLHVGRLTRNVNRDHLEEIFSIYGALKNITVPLNAFGTNRGFSYVEYENSDDATKAQKFMNGAQIDGQTITVGPVLNPRPPAPRRYSPRRRHSPNRFWRMSPPRRVRPRRSPSGSFNRRRSVSPARWRRSPS